MLMRVKPETDYLTVIQRVIGCSMMLGISLDCKYEKDDVSQGK